jgi:4-hydroxybenzoate polyprenyltransferase
MEPSAKLASELTPSIPLVVDLDSVLIRSNLFVEAAFVHLGNNLSRFGKFARALLEGKAALKSHIAATTPREVSELAYNNEVLSFIRAAVTAGTPVYLISANNERYVRAVAQHLGLFTGWFASNESENLSRAAKVRRLTHAFGEAGFDYVASTEANDPAWLAARKRLAARASTTNYARVEKFDGEVATFEVSAQVESARVWFRVVRIHQWAKNALVFVPLVTAQRFDLSALGGSIFAFLAFSLAASGIYIINDLVDIDTDRKHPTKKDRPLAAGTVPTISALTAAPILILAALIIAIFVTIQFAEILVCYVLLTSAYSLVLKRKMLVDVIALATLYTMRVVGGAAAIAVPLSEWLLGFSMFIFTAMALIKRYVELAVRLDADLPDPTNRDYLKSDLNIVAALAAASAFNAVTVFALYISSDTVHHLYRRPGALWLICPILMYWLGRALMMAHRRKLDDDPILFALKDRDSLIAFGLIVAILICAI